MKKLINLIKSFLRKGKPLPHEHGPASTYFQEKVKSMKIELASDKSSCGCGSTCKCAKSSEKLDVFKAELKKPTPKPVSKKTETTVKPLNNKPAAKKPAPKKPKAE
jgi:hypothetical protein